MIEEEVNGHQVLGDGLTVWVNSASGGAVARIGRSRIDVHSTSNTSCEDCEAVGEDTAAAWERFKKGTLKHHGVLVPEAFRPVWVKVSKPRFRP